MTPTFYHQPKQGGVVYRQKKGGEEARGFTTVRGAPQNGDGRFRDHAPDGSAALQNLYYRKRGSASYIVREVLSVRERERDTEKDGSDVTSVALKLAMNLHFPLPKIRTFRFTLHTSGLSLHGEA